MELFCIVDIHLYDTRASHKVQATMLHLEFPKYYFNEVGYLNILVNWSLTVFPGKRGSFVIISAKMQPIDQISIEVA